MNQNRENGEKPNFGPNFGPPKSFLLSFTSHIKHCCKLSLYVMSRKTNELNLRKWKRKPNFGPDFGFLAPNFDPQFFSPWVSNLY